MPVGAGAASRLDKRVRIERPVSSGRISGAGKGTWEPVCTVAASVVDALPSRGERLADGINISSRPARVRIRYRTDITSAMRFVLLRRQGGQDVPDRIMSVVAGPAEVGNREWSEFMVESTNSGGSAS